MKKLPIGDTPMKVGEHVELYGWVARVRDHKKIVFVDLRDRTGVVQVVGDESFRELSPEDVVKVTGIVKKRPDNLINKKVPTGEVEVEAKSYELLSHAETLPFDMAKEELDLTLPTLLDYRTLTLRHPKIMDIFKVQESIVEGFRDIATELDCVEIFVPEVAASATESGADVFEVNYFDHKASLTQSPQLYKQMLVPTLERVYTLAHAFRAEPSVTTRHLAETVQLDCEFGFVDFEELLDLLEKVGIGMVQHAQELHGSILKDHGQEPVLFGAPPRLTLKEAQKIIEKETGRKVVGEKDLAPDDEVALWKWAVKNHKSDFVTVTHFPTAKRAFYTMPDPNDPEVSLSYDVLFRGLEIASGSQRIHEYDKLVAAIKDRGMDPARFSMYLMAFAYGMPPEGGFSYGLERITKQMLGLANIREAALFPRDMERVDVRFSKLEEKE